MFKVGDKVVYPHARSWGVIEVIEEREFLGGKNASTTLCECQSET